MQKALPSISESTIQCDVYTYSVMYYTLSVPRGGRIEAEKSDSLLRVKHLSILLLSFDFRILKCVHNTNYSEIVYNIVLFSILLYLCRYYYRLS